MKLAEEFEIKDKVSKWLERNGIDIVDFNSSLKKDLKMDLIELVELIMWAETEFEIEITYSEGEDFDHTIATFCSLIEKKKGEENA